MKKILSLLGVITLIGTSTTILVACNTPDNENKKKITKKEPENPNINHNLPKSPLGNWKLVNGFINEKQDDNNKNYYFGIINNGSGWETITWSGKQIDWKYQYKNIYRWEGDGLPETPTINGNTGEITNWNERKEIKK
ncbi:lipoprotein [Spiroplasma endosymbiont of Polydrusus pterygomalis]|uniref:lipoprotein n=1 Tax=Spiroplasma endosymbiont of Polydrusus pterygomalis TaxID=3139327 RepID=UPI003CCADEE0